MEAALFTSDVHHMKLYSLVEMYDGTILSGDFEGRIKRWSADGQSLLDEFKGHPENVYSIVEVVAHHGDDDGVEPGLFVSADFKNIVVWTLDVGMEHTFKIKTKNLLEHLYLLQLKHNNHQQKASINNKRKDKKVSMLVGCSTHLIKWTLIYNTSMSKYTQRVAYSEKIPLKQQSYLSCMCELKNGLVLVGTWNNFLQLYNLNTKECVQTFAEHTNRVNDAVELRLNSPSTVIASASSDKTVKLWDIHSGECWQTLKGHTRAVTALVSWESEGNLMSGSLDRTIRRWDTKNGTCIWKTSFENRINKMIALKEGGSLSVGFDNNRVSICKLQARSLVQLCSVVIAKQALKCKANNWKDVFSKVLPEELMDILMRQSHQLANKEEEYEDDQADGLQ
eukprot:TRINITY_DN6653_c0_g1_i1.p1 TRINITY_DN6653_c0_g1~~TRINITY_DN6653_c0_g1_i1.p1  ORF type:complete len:394 (-),score=101.95 TRINITY_DN6653_c0_g1_i1:258-1439(-)